MAVINRVEKLSQIDVHNPAASQLHLLFPQRFQCSVSTASGTKPVRDVPKVRLVHRLQRHQHRALEDLILERGDTRSALPPHPNRLRVSSRLPIPIIRSAASKSRSSAFGVESIPISSSDSPTGGMPPSP